MAGDVAVTTWGGHNINDGTTYLAWLAGPGGEVAADSLNQNRVGATAIEAGRPSKAPTYVRNDPVARRINLTIQVVDATTANIEQLKAWFDSDLGQQYLVGTVDATTRRIQCFPESMTSETPNVYIISLLASAPWWEENSAQAPSDTVVTASGQTFSLTNPGSARCYPTLTITPGTVMDHANSWIKRRRIVIANRSPLPISDPVGDGWPVNVFGTTLDTDALNTAGKVQSDLDDLRVILEGAEIHRWPDPATDDAASRLWCNLQFRPRKTMTMPVAASAASPANGAAVTVTNAQGTAGWPDDGYLLWENECVHYTSKTATTITLSSLDGRGARGTTAASHSAGLTAYWVEHPFLDVIYDYSGATNPNPPDDRKPLIDLANSTNAKFAWSAAFLQTGRRSACWQPVFSDEGYTADYIRLYESGGALIFEDAAPVAGKPRYNNVVIDIPYGIKAAAGGVELDFTVQNGLYLPAYLTDLDGYETSLFTQGPTAALANQQYTPGAVSSRLRLGGRNGCVTGNRSGTGTVSITSDTVRFREEDGAIGFTLDVASVITGFLLKLEDGNPASTRGLKLLLDEWPGRAAYRPGTWESQDMIFSWPNHVYPFTGATGVISGVTDTWGVAPTPWQTEIAAIANASIPANGAAAEVVVALSSPLYLPAGDYQIILIQDGAVSNTNRLYRNTLSHNAKTKSIGFVMQFGAQGQYLGVAVQTVSGEGYSQQVTNFISPWFCVLTKSTPAQDDAPVESTDKITIDNIELLADDATPRTPLIVVGAEEVLYLMQARLKNDTTGDYVDVYHPMTLGQNVVIDCEARTIYDGQTGRYIPFAATWSNPDAGIYCQPGANTWSYTEVGVVSTSVAKSLRGRWS